MLGFGDHISESITHFMGYFHTSIEAVKLRLDYREFKVAPNAEPELNPLLVVETNPEQYVAPASSQASVKYLPTPWAPTADQMMTSVSYDTLELELHGQKFHHLKGNVGVGGGSRAVDQDSGPYFGLPPSETAVVLQQTSHLEDNDIIIMGNHVPVDLNWGDDAAFTSLTGLAFSVSEPFDAASSLDSVADIPQFFANQMSAMQGFAAPAIAGADISVVSADHIEGTYVNGSAELANLRLEDYLPQPTEAATDGQITAGAEGATIKGTEIDDSVTLKAGGNLMVNQVSLQSLDSVGAHFAVAGNYYDISAIVQVNAYSDSDVFEGGFAGLGAAPSTQAMNIASFLYESAQGQNATIPGEAPTFPQNWQISVVTGDLLQMNWISQYSFMSDNDVHVLSATGAYTTIVTGSNGSMNSASFADLCKSYDLVMIGGNYYDGNFIFQTNILFDNDKFTTGGAAGEYSGGLSSSGNLLWNSASIANTGGANWVNGLPQHYADAFSQLAGGNYTMPSGFGADAALQGIEGLRVLYISGNVYDLNYIKQVNVLGDADYVAHYEDALLSGSDGTEWDISTGSNALINIASIEDMDANGGGTSYAGGGVYSDAILIQADIIAPAPAQNGQQPLANELVAFLDDDAPGHAAADHGPAVDIPDTGPAVDVMQTVLA
ncbi:hypothetical protein OSJ77_07155 [Phyllobacterium sp. 0TCS1.6C]|uniref:hypothetical protein n=1 Tax=unclassified Phyllobacterium TaxID=2638441 RepID=UPI002264B12E|nr:MULTISPECIES: hypothetical protein [unclassified Phyllobacterium]MCX8279960.1 hypothetical protein [Phyllobacterium sp. 0TCS1.6C]MCX8296127.1 hypothetical protein [Phyllobacterium sp. 0TCS1.6A]